LARCIRTMCTGMPSFERRTSTAGLADMREMDRYCYYVAGIVGQTLTDLFCDYSPRIAERREAMSELDVSFGQGLQMTNILKDFWEDRDRGACWLPHDLFASFGVKLEDVHRGDVPAAFGKAYAQLIGMMACDPNVALLNFFHAVDETSLPAWQSGLVLPDGTRRASFNAVRDAIMANQECRGKLVEWRHTDRVVGAGVSFKTLPRSFLVRADEGFSYEVKITRTSSTRRLTGAVGQGEAARDLLFKLPRLGRGAYRVTVTLHAETNAQRVTTFSRTFRR